MKIKKKDKKKGRVEVLLRPTKVQRIVSFDSDILAKIEDWRSSREPVPSFSEACNELLRKILRVSKVAEKRKEK